MSFCTTCRSVKHQISVLTSIITNDRMPYTHSVNLASKVDGGVVESLDSGGTAGDSWGDHIATAPMPATYSSDGRSRKNVDLRVWKAPETKALMATRIEMTKEFEEQGYKSHGYLWNQVGEQIRALPGSAPVTAEQCKTKWKALKKVFMLTREANLHRSANDKKTCKFYDQFFNLYGDKVPKKPTCVLSSSNQRNNTLSSSNQRNDAETYQEGDEPVPKKRRQSSSAPIVSSTLDWVERHEEQTKAYREDMLALRKEEIATNIAYQEKRLAVLHRIAEALERK